MDLSPFESLFVCVRTAVWSKKTTPNLKVLCRKKTVLIILKVRFDKILASHLEWKAAAGTGRWR
jgi:hypothetical protein